MADVTQSNRLVKRVGWFLPILGLMASTVLSPATAMILTREATASQVIAQIPVKGRAPKTG
jgi:hypothetical protein